MGLCLLRAILQTAEEFRAALEQVIANQLDPLYEVNKLYDQVFLAWDDDSGQGYDAAMEYTIPADGAYWLVTGGVLSTQGWQTFGGYQLLIGLDAPEVLTGVGTDTGNSIAYVDRLSSQISTSVQENRGELTQDHPTKKVTLNNFTKGDTLYVYMEPTSGDLTPTVMLLDYGGKPVASGNLAGAQREAKIEYTFSENASKYILEISACCRDKIVTSGEYRLLVGVNSPEVLNGQGEEIGKEILQLPTDVKIGVKLQQITNVDQKAENFGAVASLMMEWIDPALAFRPDECDCRFKIYTGDSFHEFIEESGGIWPEFTLFNQQGNRWTQNRLVIVEPDGKTIYFERFTTDFQAPDFDFKTFPFDSQEFYIRVDAIYPEEYSVFSILEGYTEVGNQLGEEEWYVVDHNTEISTEMANTCSINSRFSLGFTAHRHLEYYIFRIFVPLLLILFVSWITFFLKDFGKRVDVTTGNLLLFIAFNFTISNDLPRLGYLTFLDVLLIATFITTVVVVLYNVILKRMETTGKEEQAHRIDRFGVWVYPLFYLLAVLIVMVIFF